MSEQMSGAPDLAGMAAMIGYLCVECRRCSRRTVFEAGSQQARTGAASLRGCLVCRRCGARLAYLRRAASLRDAKRWREERG